MDRDLSEVESKRAALLRRKQELTRKLALKQQTVSDLQEDSLMCVPQHLLTQVKGGSLTDFKAVHSAMRAECRADMDDFEKALQDTQGLLDDANAFLLGID